MDISLLGLPILYAVPFLPDTSVFKVISSASAK
jgi:hypothetical protein